MEPENHKLLTIIIPCFNSEKYILKALENIYSIDPLLIEKIEVLLIDDGSKLEFKNYLDSIKENNFTYKYFYKKNGNWGSVINFVKNNNLASGKYVTILDSDDWYLPNKINKILNKIENEKTNDQLIVSKFYLCTRKIDHLKTTTIFFRSKSKIINKYQALTPFSMPLGKFYSNELFYKLNDLKEEVIFQDMLLYIDAISKVKNVRFINIKVGVWNLTNETSSTNIPWNEKKLNVLYDNLKIIEKYNNKYFNGYALMYWMLLVKKNMNILDLNFNLKKINVQISWLPKIFQRLARMVFFLVVKKNLNSKIKKIENIKES